MSCSQQGEIYSVCASTYVMHQHSIIYGFNAVSLLISFFFSLRFFSHTKNASFFLCKRTSKTKWKAFNSYKKFKSQTKYSPHYPCAPPPCLALSLSLVYRFAWLQNRSSIYVKFIVYVWLLLILRRAGTSCAQNGVDIQSAFPRSLAIK